MDIAYDGTWGYHPLIVSPANPGEVLSIVNRPGSRPSHEDAAREADRALLLCVRFVSEDVAEFDYRPSACRKTYRMVVVRKNLSVEKGEQVLFPDERYFFYITNERNCTRDEVVYEANDRCNQENHIAQLKSGCRALHAPVDNLESNWAYMVMTALAWNLKAWWALSLSAPPGRWQERHQKEKEQVLRMEFKSFVNAFVLLPCRILRTGGKVVYRLSSWNPHLSIFFRLWNVVRC